MMRTSSALLFDFDHTLGIDNRLEERVLRGLAARYCNRLPTDAEIAAVLQKFRSGQRPLDATVMDAVTEWGGAAMPEIALEYRAVAIALVPSSVEPMPGALELFALLASKGTPHAILSNGWSELQAAKAAAIGYPNRVITSEEVAAWKPDAAAFLRGASLMGFTASETLYVGDSPLADVAGSKGAGMRAVWADFEGKEYPADIPTPDFVVTRLTEIIEILSGEA